MPYLLFFLISFFTWSSVQAQTTKLSQLPTAERQRKVIQIAYQALDQELALFLEKRNGSPLVNPPSYYAFIGSYKEYIIKNNEDLESISSIYGRYITDMDFYIGDYIYSISFTNSPYLWKPLLYMVEVLENGKAYVIRLEQDEGFSKIIYKNNN